MAREEAAMTALPIHAVLPDLLAALREGIGRRRHHIGVGLRPEADEQPGPVRYLGLITSEDDVAGAQARRPSIEKSRRYKGHPRLAQICLELVHLREAFENDRIVAAECQTSPGKAKQIGRAHV